MELGDFFFCFLSFGEVLGFFGGHLGVTLDACFVHLADPSYLFVAPSKFSHSLFCLWLGMWSVVFGTWWLSPFKCLLIFCIAKTFFYFICVCVFVLPCYFVK